MAGAVIMVLSDMVLAQSDPKVSASAPVAGQRVEDVFYQPVQRVVQTQSQVVFFRQGAKNAAVKAAPAHLYVDGEFHSSLQPLQYSGFCVKPGNHTIEAYIGDAPLYRGKALPQSQMTVEGGKTYFVSLPEEGTARAQPYSREAAERMLSGSKLQRHFVSRASAIIACDHVAAAEPIVKPILRLEKKTYSIKSGVLFGFGKSSLAGIGPEGQAELGKVVREIAKAPEGGVRRVVVRGHADPIGSMKRNLKLSGARAQTVRHYLIQAGLPAMEVEAVGMGSEEPVVSCSKKLPKRHYVACNSNNRRADIQIEFIK